MSQVGLFKAIQYFGTQRKLARAIGVSQQAISQWLCREQKIPYAQVIKISNATNGVVDVDELAPTEKRTNATLKNLTKRHSSRLLEIPISQIDSDDQCCPIFGNHKNLLEIMSEKEMVHPVWVDTDYRLITCECRIRICYLQRKKTISCYIVDLKNILKEEEEIVADIHALPISEKIAFGKRLEKQIGNRQGSRTDLNVISLPQNFAEVRFKGMETRTIIAKVIGFGNHQTYQNAKQVTQTGIPPLVYLMDRQCLSISKAAQLCKLPFQDQYNFIQQLLDKKSLKNKTIDRNILKILSTPFE